MPGTGGAGHVDAAGQTARFNDIHGLSYDEHAAALVCADTSNHRIRKICMMSAKATTIAGSGIAALKNGLGTAAAFHSPYGALSLSLSLSLSYTYTSVHGYIYG